ncbi:MAG TPA: protein kinase [Steroidobacteraceae bacterium]|nr:protein kinase [Steroidobacteraceae bacterium]
MQAPPASGDPLVGLSAAEYARLSALLDDLLEAAPAQRETRLSELDQLEPTAARWLREVLAAQGSQRLQQFLESRDILAHAGPAWPGSDAALVGRVFGPYRVLSLLGHGGMGSVWLAERTDGLFTRRLALKLVHPALMGQVMMERLGREREILASLSHPNIARLLDAGVAEDGQPYLALEYVAGTPLTTHCDRHCLSVRERLDLLRQVLSAVQYAHAHLVIHRDLKPSNILVSEDGQIRLLDFGIAKLLTEAGTAQATELTLLGGRALTPDYAAPEQIAGAPVTTAADVYALGVMLYELLTGERPYRPKRDSRGALEEAILEEDVIAPSRLGMNEAAAHSRCTTPRKLTRMLSGDLDTIVLRALRKNAAERYATVNALAEDIERYLRGEAILARRDSLIYRARKFAWRYRVGIGIAGAVLLTLAGGLAATTYEARVASAERDAALEADRRLLIQTAASRLGSGDVSGSQSIILEVLPHKGSGPPYTTAALTVFDKALAQDAQDFALLGHTDRVRSIAYSPDGRRLITASYDGTARIWDASTGRQMLILQGHGGPVLAATFSPDGRRVATGSYDKTARIWDAATGRQLLVLPHQERVRSVAFSPDGHQLITGAYDKAARIWDAATGRQVRVLTGHSALVTSAAFSPDGRRIVTASYDKTARIWAAATGRLIRVLAGHSEILTSAAFSADGQRVVTASGDRTARVWDSNTGRQIAMLSGHTQLVSSAVFSADGRRVLTSSYDQTARIWDADSGRQISVLSGHTDFVEGAVFSPDGLHVATASSDETARVWEAVPKDQMLLLAGHHGTVSSAAYSPDGHRIVTSSFDKTARIWDASSGTPLITLTGHASQVATAAFSPDGTRVVTASLDGTARIWDVATGRELRVLSGHTDRVVSAAFSPHGHRVVTTSLDKTGRVWDAATGRQIAVLAGHTLVVETGAFSPDGRRVVTASDDGTARIWDAATGRQIMLLVGHTDQLGSASYSDDGQRIITASDDGTARIWDAQTGRQIGVLNRGSRVTNASFSRDGRLIATASDDGTISIWDAASEWPVKVLSGHTETVDTAAFSPDGHFIVSASDDGTARIWDARAAPLDTQISWAEAAHFDALTSTEREALGLPPQPGVRNWPLERTRCDDAAAAPYDPDRRAPGVMADGIVVDIASRACGVTAAMTAEPDARTVYQRGRTRWAGGDGRGARQDFETALRQGYRAAAVDLARLLLQSPTASPDPRRAASLLERAWHDGVSVAAFDLGELYEQGVRRAEGTAGYWIPLDPARASVWYQRGAAAADPNALGRLAEREEEIAYRTTPRADSRTHLLRAFRYYAAAAERARREDWPNVAWRSWRYRRASLARRLAHEGLMRQVAAIYDNVR